MKKTSSKRIDIPTPSPFALQMKNDAIQPSSPAKAPLDIARDRKTSSKTLDALSTDPNKMVRQAVAIHPNTSSLTLDALSYDQDPLVRLHVANHDNTEYGTLLWLEQDFCPWVRNTAKRRCDGVGGPKSPYQSKLEAYQNGDLSHDDWHSFLKNYTRSFSLSPPNKPKPRQSDIEIGM